jgi:uncharacterized protein
MSTLHFPFQIGSLGAPRVVGNDEAISQKLHQLLFTRRGERVNRPRYGSGVQELVFSGAGRDATAAAEFTIAADIARHLPEVKLDAVRVTTADATLFIDILYTVLASGEELAASFRAPLEGPR